MSSNLENINNIISEYNKSKSKMIKEINDKVKEFMIEIFNRNPKLQSFSWNQYTPYFNDGDECKFCVNGITTINNLEFYNEISEKLNTETIEYIYVDDNSVSIGEYIRKPNENYDPEYPAMVDDINKFIETIPTELFFDIWGDHVEVVVTKLENGSIEINSKSYDHE